MRRPLSFDQRFAEWLDDGLARPVPKPVRAFVFGVSRRELAFVVELNGTAEFNPSTSGWTWSEIWSPEVPKLTVPAQVCCGRLSECSRQVREAVRRYLESGVFARRLTATEGIAIETLNEGYALIWTPNQTKQERLFG